MKQKKKHLFNNPLNTFLMVISESPARQMRVKILTDELKNAATSPDGRSVIFSFKKIYINLLLIFFNQLSFCAHLRSHQIIVLVSMLPEFAEQSRFLCRVSVDFGSRLLSMVPLLKSFHNVVIFLLQ